MIWPTITVSKSEAEAMYPRRDASPPFSRLFAIEYRYHQAMMIARRRFVRDRVWDQVLKVPSWVSIPATARYPWLVRKVWGLFQ